VFHPKILVLEQRLKGGEFSISGLELPSDKENE